MNIFYLDKNPAICAQYHCDKHCVKMILESCQLLCTAHRVLDSSNHPILYKQTHTNHPSAVWVRKSLQNYQWLCQLTLELCKEYTHRYNKVHACQSKGLVEYLINNPPLYFVRNINRDLGFTDPPLAMPDHCKIQSSDEVSDEVTDEVNAVESYRNYYLKEKLLLLKYKNREIPSFITYERFN